MSNNTTADLVKEMADNARDIRRAFSDNPVTKDCAPGLIVADFWMALNDENLTVDEFEPVARHALSLIDATHEETDCILTALKKLDILIREVEARAN